ncbi:MAG: formylglycine-generating enzyme family protein, partial [Bacteroidota bacterium]
YGMPSDYPAYWSVPLDGAPDLEFVLVKKGQFIMGDDDGIQDDEKPEHSVEISQDFYLGRYPVTQAQWQVVMDDNPANFKGDDRRPVENVSWGNLHGIGEGAKSGFLDRLFAHTDYPDNSFRLPTEAEWEYAAKGGHLTARTKNLKEKAPDLYSEYAGGDDVISAAWQDNNNGYSTIATGYRQPNALGLYGMSGNVYDWCQDTWDAKTYSKRKEELTVDPFIEAAGQDRVVRGGSWVYIPGSCRPVTRNHRLSSYRFRYFGFRLVLSPSSAQRG